MSPASLLLRSCTRTVHLAFRLTSFQRVPPAASNFFLQPYSANAERTPSRASISVKRSSSAPPTFFEQVRRASASLFTETPRAMLAFSAATPPPEIAAPEPNRILRTPNASAISTSNPQASAARRAPVGLPTIARTARAESARCSPLATTRDFPATPHTMQINAAAKRKKLSVLTNSPRYMMATRWQTRCTAARSCEMKR